MSTERRLEYAGLAVGYGISIPAGTGRHKNSVFGRFNLRRAFEGWDTTRKGRLLLPRREPVRRRFCGVRPYVLQLVDDALDFRVRASMAECEWLLRHRHRRVSECVSSARTA